MSANERQVAGVHYQAGIQHWDYAASHDFDYFQGQITKYITRWKRKNGLQDLEKARHFLEKYIEIEQEKLLMAQKEVEEFMFEPLAHGYVDQDGPSLSGVAKRSES